MPRPFSWWRCGPFSFSANCGLISGVGEVEAGSMHDAKAISGVSHRHIVFSARCFRIVETWFVQSVKLPS